MKNVHFIALILVITGSSSIQAQQSDRSAGQHPAVIAKRLSEQQRYDYAAKFYPHPAWLYLRVQAEEPKEPDRHGQDLAQTLISTPEPSQTALRSDKGDAKSTTPSTAHKDL